MSFRPPNPPTNPGLADLSAEFAKIRYEQALSGTYARSTGVLEFAALGLRSLIITNGGALIGLITFLGNFPDRSGALGALIAAVCFAVGLFAALICVLLSYLAQQHFFWTEMHSCDREAREMFGIDFQDTAKAESDEHDTGSGYQRGAIFVAVASAVLFLVGAIVALWALIGA